MGAKSQKRNINTQIIFTMMGLLILCVFFSITTKSFLTQRNLLNIATQTSVAVIVAIAETYIIASGCIDLSVGSGVAFSGLVVASAMKAGKMCIRDRSPPIRNVASIWIIIQRV